jgi:hypothetical protein
VILGLSSRMSGVVRLIVMFASRLRGPKPAGCDRSAAGRGGEAGH